jgi:hypothetical protein
MRKKWLPPHTPNVYTCNEYREEMMLLALRQKLADSRLDKNEKSVLEKEITALEKKIGL